MNKKVAREIGAALGLVKSGAVEIVEAKNAGMMKIASAIHRLYKQGKLKKGSRMEKVAVDWGRLATGAGGGAATGSAIGGALGLAGGPFAGLTVPVGMGLGGLFGGGIGAIGSMFGGGDKKPQGMGVGASTAGGPQLTPALREGLRAAGFDEAAINQLTSGAAGGAAGGVAGGAAGGKQPDRWGGSDQNFYAEQPDDVRNDYLKYMGITPGQYAGRQSSMLAGLGRARQAAETNRWLQAMTSGIV